MSRLAAHITTTVVCQGYHRPPRDSSSPYLHPPSPPTASLRVPRRNRDDIHDRRLRHAGERHVSAGIAHVQQAVVGAVRGAQDRRHARGAHQQQRHQHDDGYVGD